ncbi:MAG: lipocalin family protein [Vicinamibacterales bacterium]
MPRVVEDFSALRLAGDWYEVAGTGSWSTRRCVSDTRYSFRAKGAAVSASRACTTAVGIERRRGLAKGDGSGTGALKLRLVWPIFAPLSAAWSDFWILAAGDGDTWLLVGDRDRARLSLLSRTVALDESAFAQAIAAARSAGYSADGLAPVAHPAGATGLSASP